MIRGDSTEYNLLQKWCETSPHANQEASMSCEIGVREGMSSKIILDYFKPQVHIGIDPYGSRIYQHYDPGMKLAHKQPDGSWKPVRDNSEDLPLYTDEMYHQMMKDFAEYTNFQMYKITDIDFMKRFNYMDGYSFVHFDGPHTTKDVIREAVYFADRAVDYARFVFDDYPKYNMSKICDLLAYWDFRVLEKGDNKICLEKVKQK